MIECLSRTCYKETHKCSRKASMFRLPQNVISKSETFPDIESQINVNNFVFEINQNIDPWG